MARTSGMAQFTLVDLHQVTENLLEANPGTIVTYRLLREVLRLAPDDPRLVAAKNVALSSKWVCQLEQAQLPDGSWGRFHTQDTNKKTLFRTTDEAIDRAFALGLEPSDTYLIRAHNYIQAVLSGDSTITDRYKKNDAFPVLIKFILAGRLAQIDPSNKIVDSYWAYMLEVAIQAFNLSLWILVAVDEPHLSPCFLARSVCRYAEPIVAPT